MARYRKKPVEVEAIQFKGDVGVKEIVDLDLPGAHIDGVDVLYIDTPKGAMIVRPGDWIIISNQGELYPCKPDFFEATYEPV